MLGTLRTTIVEQLSAYAIALRYEDLPSEVVQQAKRLIVDSVGCALGGYASEPAKIACAMATTVTSSEPATVIGSGARSSIDMATFANGVMLRFLDFNDGYTSTGESGRTVTLGKTPRIVTGGVENVPICG